MKPLNKIKKEIEELQKIIDGERIGTGIFKEAVTQKMICQALLKQTEEIIEIISKMKPYDEEGIIYGDLINREELKSALIGEVKR